jgi:hypothetical protein
LRVNNKSGRVSIIHRHEESQVNSANTNLPILGLIKDQMKKPAIIEEKTDGHKELNTNVQRKISSFDEVEPPVDIPFEQIAGKFQLILF